MTKWCEIGQAIREAASSRSVSASTRCRFIDSWNERCEPSIWTEEAADMILAQGKRSSKTKDSVLTRHTFMNS